MTNKTVVVHDIALHLWAPYCLRLPTGALAIALLFCSVHHHYAFRTFSNLQVETRKVLEALADSIDMRDGYIYRHSQRVAEGGADRGGDRSAGGRHSLIVSAARLRSGKVSWDNDILAKPGPLMPEEWGLSNGTFSCGGYAQGLEPLPGCVPLIRHHHERYDGRGYPDGLGARRSPRARSLRWPTHMMR